MKWFVCCLCFAVEAMAQVNPQMSALEINQTCARVLQLTDASGIAIPALRRAAEPLIDSVKQACSQLEQRPAEGQPSYLLLTHLRAFLNLADAVPKPYPMPDIARDQLREIRDAATRFEAHFLALLDQKDADLRSPDRDSVLRFGAENRLVPPPKPNHRRVVFLGDSVTAEWRLNQYFPDEDYLNRGIGGQLSGQLLTRMKSDVLDLKPAAVVLQAGGFDLARGVPLELIAGNIQLMADIAAANNVKAILVSALPGHPQAGALNDWLKSFAAQRKLTYIDFHSTLAGIADAIDEGVPNSKGYRLIAPVLARALEQTLRLPPAPVPVKTKPPAKK